MPGAAADSGPSWEEGGKELATMAPALLSYRFLPACFRRVRLNEAAKAVRLASEVCCAWS